MMKEKINDIGIYTNIHESGNRSKSRHKLYYATCSQCGVTVEKTIKDIQRSNKVCRHKKISKVNDMPSGWIAQSELNMRIYDMWKAMLTRTTQKYWDKYPTYTGTTVDESWRKLSNFVNDIQELQGYDIWVNSPKEMMMLDKDTLFEGNKHYSKDTCCFITHAESNHDVSKRHPENLEKARCAYVEQSSKSIKLTHKKTGETRIFSSIKEACRTMNFNQRNVWMVLSDKYPGCHSVKGWSVEYVNKDEKNNVEIA